MTLRSSHSHASSSKKRCWADGRNSGARCLLPADASRRRLRRSVRYNRRRWSGATPCIVASSSTASVSRDMAASQLKNANAARAGAVGAWLERWVTVAVHNVVYLDDGTRW